MTKNKSPEYISKKDLVPWAKEASPLQLQESLLTEVGENELHYPFAGANYFWVGFFMRMQKIGYGLIFVNHQENDEWVRWERFYPVRVFRDKLKRLGIGTIADIETYLELIERDEIGEDFKVISNQLEEDRERQFERLGIIYETYEMYKTQDPKAIRDQRMTVREQLDKLINYANGKGFFYKNPFSRRSRSAKKSK